MRIRKKPFLYRVTLEFLVSVDPKTQDGRAAMDYITERLPSSLVPERWGFKPVRPQPWDQVEEPKR